ncbi:DNA glycosylase [Lentinula edodes]|uniref:Endonuclease III homolog n=1 Tax=Lentinula edodes TaxID=5353 RepID=A0A1Q3ED08_LENED|nr:DNA glycosylase [Lentinula edodes]
MRNLAERESEETRPVKRVKRVHVHEPSTSRVPESRSPRKPKQGTSTSGTPDTPGTPHSAPAHWRQAYSLIHEMRYTPSGCARDAPVDTMGCDIAGEAEDDDKNKRFSILISLMLSSQTKDLVTHTAVSALRSALRSALGSPGLSASALASASPSLVQGCINKVGFWRRKAEYIQKTAVICRDRYGGDVPKTLGELLELPGVGKKMGYLMLGSGWGLNVGIGVDVHVHRISNRLGWHDPPTKTPEQTRINLESWLPRDLHQKINHLLVGFGQTICTPVKPKCSECSLSSIEGLCPSSSSSSSPSHTKLVPMEDKETGLDTSGKVEVEVGTSTSTSTTTTVITTKPETVTETHMLTDTKTHMLTDTKTHMQTQTQTQTTDDSEQKNTMIINDEENTNTSTTNPPIGGGPRITIQIESEQ